MEIVFIVFFTDLFVIKICVGLIMQTDAALVNTSIHQTYIVIRIEHSGDILGIVTVTHGIDILSAVD